VQPYTDGSPFNIGANPLALAVDPNEAFLYVLCGDSTLRVLAIDYAAGGHIAQVASVQLLGQPSGLAVEPKGQFIYTSDNTGVKAFAVNARSGALSPVALKPSLTLANLKGIYAEPAGQYLYVATGAQNVAGAVFGFSIGIQGNLTPLSALPLASPALPSSMVFTDDIR
jgi:DNA-binding beta-propeller fold protein YncE